MLCRALVAVAFLAVFLGALGQPVRRDAPASAEAAVQSGGTVEDTSATQLQEELQALQARLDTLNGKPAKKHTALKSSVSRGEAGVSRSHTQEAAEDDDESESVRRHAIQSQLVMDDGTLQPSVKVPNGKQPAAEKKDTTFMLMWGGIAGLGIAVLVLFTFCSVCSWKCVIGQVSKCGKAIGACCTAIGNTLVECWESVMDCLSSVKERIEDLLCGCC